MSMILYTYIKTR